MPLPEVPEFIPDEVESEFREEARQAVRSTGARPHHGPRKPARWMEEWRRLLLVLSLVVGSSAVALGQFFLWESEPGLARVVLAGMGSLGLLWLLYGAVVLVRARTSRR